MKNQHQISTLGVAPFLTLKRRHKWFSHISRDAEDGWNGPHPTMEAAALAYMRDADEESPVFVAQGRKLTAAEIEEFGVDFGWQVETKNAVKIELPPL